MSSQYEHDVVAHSRELRECWRDAKKLDTTIMQDATTGDDAHKRQEKKKAVMVFRQRKAIGDSNAHLLNGVRLVKTHHDKVQRILKAHRAFKKKVKRNIRAGLPPSDWNLAALVDDFNSDSEL